jgi:hypothetical protein
MPVIELPAASPTVVGASLLIVAASGERATFDLPAAGWAAYETATRFQYVFKNRTAPLGLSMVKVAALKRQGALKVAAKSSGLTLDEPSQGAVSIVLRIGDDMYCSRCETPTVDVAGHYRGRTCPAPAIAGASAATAWWASRSSATAPTSARVTTTLPCSSSCPGARRQANGTCD